MDPQACLERLIDALAERDHAEAWYSSDDMLTWIDKGGAVPTVSAEQLRELLIVVRRAERSAAVGTP